MDLFSKKLNLSHSPTLFLLVGYPVYWIELLIIQKAGGVTTGLGWIILIVLVFIICTKLRVDVKSIARLWDDLSKINKLLFLVGAGLVFIILAQGFYAALLPVHLTQEFDALNYHLTIPRQHLIIHSFRHLPWSSMDLFLLPIDFALAPFWLFTQFPNKIPQFFFLLGLVAITARLTYLLSNQSRVLTALSIFAVLSFHSVGIQVGLAMTDIVIAYLFLAAIDSLWRGNYFLASVEGVFYFWSKPLIPLQAVLVAVMLIILYQVLNKKGSMQLSLGFCQSLFAKTFDGVRQNLKKMMMYIPILSLFIAGPFLLKSMYYAHTPLFPLAVGSVALPNWSQQLSSKRLNDLQQSAKVCLSIKDGYGSGCSIPEFLKHVWLIAVPEKGVNNRYDYPVGLMYLLLLAPFFYFLIHSFKQKVFPILPLTVLLFWLTWWFSSQQSRFLLIPLLLMAISVISAIKTPSRVFIGSIIVALMLTTLSVVRAHQPDWGKTSQEVLRQKDLELLKLNNVQGHHQLDIDYIDAAYASFPIRVIKHHSYSVLDSN